MDILISNASEKPLYEQITTQIKMQILNNTLKEGEALPSIRLLAKELRISVITTKRAYEELERAGFIETVPGKGSFISAKNKTLFKEQQYRLIEEDLISAIEKAKVANITKEELKIWIDTLFEV